MALRIRLARGGAKKRPFYRIVVADSRSPRDGRFIERIGTYNPMVPKDHPERVRLDEARARHWLSAGATPSDRVARFLGQANIIEMPPIPQQTKKSQPKAKAVERMKAAEEAKKAAEEAPKEAAEETPKAVPVEESPASEEAPAAEAAAEAAAEPAPSAESEAAEEEGSKEEGAEEAAKEEATKEEGAEEEPKTD